MQTLFLDLDNTLLYSHRHVLDVPKRAAEFLNGKEQSFISEKTYAYLSARRDLRIVPVTTRTLPQVKRIEGLLNGLGCRFSLICNGGILLHEGEIDPGWMDESLRLSAAEREELPAAAQWLRSRCGLDAVHTAADLFVYAAAEDPAGAAAELRRIADTQKVDVLWDSRKVYCIPKTINKGSALQRFARRHAVSFSIAAGDSDFDIPMLNRADLAILPAVLADKVCSRRKIVVEDRPCFSDAICACLQTLSRS